MERKTTHNSLLQKWVLLPAICLLISNCAEKNRSVKSTLHYIPPIYNPIEFQLCDTIHFPLDKDSYNSIKSYNTFFENNHEYISFFDDRSNSINIYRFNSQRLIKKLPLTKFRYGKKLYKTSIYTKSFDSIFITNFSKLFLIDSSGAIKKTIDFLEEPERAWACFENANQPIFKDNILYASVRPHIKQTSFEAIKEWKVLYSFNMLDGKAALHYQLPELYKKNLYGRDFLDYSYCYNNRQNFVFSFPADTNIYETNLDTYHVAYYGKSKFQQQTINPVSKEDLLNNNGYKKYLTSDSYGPIYYDPLKKTYLRFVKQKISESDYNDKNFKRNVSVVVFDDNLKIRGETMWNDSISYKSIFFAGHGMYARILSADENALHFVRLEYGEKPSGLTVLNKNKVITKK